MAMKAFLILLRGCPVAFLVLSLFLPSPARAALSSNSKATTSATNSAPAEIPQSVFVNPGNPSDGRDPFFPKSLRPYSSGQSITNSLPQAYDLVLNGLSGTPEHRLAMINGRTFAEGEKAEVTTRNGRALLRCIQIKDESVVIEIEGSRRELRLRRGL